MREQRLAQVKINQSINGVSQILSRFVIFLFNSKFAVERGAAFLHMFPKKLPIYKHMLLPAFLVPVAVQSDNEHNGLHPDDYLQLPSKTWYTYMISDTEHHNIKD